MFNKFMSNFRGRRSAFTVILCSLLVNLCLGQRNFTVEIDVEKSYDNSLADYLVDQGQEFVVTSAIYVDDILRLQYPGYFPGDVAINIDYKSFKTIVQDLELSGVNWVAISLAHYVPGSFRPNGFANLTLPNSDVIYGWDTAKFGSKSGFGENQIKDFMWDGKSYGKVQFKVKFYMTRCMDDEYIVSPNDFCAKCPQGHSCNGIDAVVCMPGQALMDGLCKNCPAGTKSAHFGSTECEDCGTGKWSDEGQSFCSKCKAGYYGEGKSTEETCDGTCQVGRQYSAEGSSSCSTCALGSLPNDDHSDCVHCVAGTYHNITTDTCELCPQGSYSDFSGATTCKQCEAGYYGNNTGSSSSTCDSICSAGFKCPRGSKNETKCEPGYYSVQGSAECTKCDAGRYGAADTVNVDSLCTGPCEAGYSCPAGAVSPKHEKCGAGKWSAEGASTCFDCKAGYFGNGFGKSETCDGACDGKGQYSLKGAETCSTCPAGSIPNNDHTDCVMCTKGTFHDLESGKCVPCAAGTYTDFNGATTCKACKSGFVGENTGSTSAECDGACQAGYSCPEGSSEQHPCPPGHYSEQGSTKCDKCLPGHYGLGKSTTSQCDGPCAAGHFCVEGSTSPQHEICPAGQYSPEGSHECTDCPEHSTSTTGSGTCTSCPAGQFTNGTKSTSCEDCPKGMWSDGSGKDCMECKAGYYGSGKGTSQECDGRCVGNSYSQPGFGTCLTCEHGSIAKQENTVCVKCSPGSYHDLETNSCRLCKEGTYSENSGSTHCSPCKHGFLGFAKGNAKPECDRKCSAGHYCPEGSKEELECPPGHYSLEGSWECKKCDEGFYGTGKSEKSTCNGLCDEGYTCPAGSTSPNSKLCDDGTEGIICPKKCDNPTQYCPKGEGVKTVTPGHYTVLSTDGTVRISEKKCDAGYKCNNGIRQACAKDYFQTLTGQTECTSCSVLSCPEDSYRQGCGGSSPGVCTKCSKTKENRLEECGTANVFVGCDGKSLFDVSQCVSCGNFTEDTNFTALFNTSSSDGGFTNPCQNLKVEVNNGIPVWVIAVAVSGVVCVFLLIIVCIVKRRRRIRRELEALELKNKDLEEDRNLAMALEQNINPLHRRQSKSVNPDPGADRVTIHMHEQEVGELNDLNRKLGDELRRLKKQQLQEEVDTSIKKQQRSGAQKKRKKEFHHGGEQQQLSDSTQLAAPGGDLSAI